MKDIEAAYDKVVAQIRAQYSLGTFDQHAQDGAWRKVEIKVQRPDLKGAQDPSPQRLLRALPGTSQ